MILTTKLSVTLVMKTFLSLQTNYNAFLHVQNFITETDKKLMAITVSAKMNFTMMVSHANNVLKMLKHAIMIP